MGKLFASRWSRSRGSRFGRSERKSAPASGSVAGYDPDPSGDRWLETRSWIAVAEIHDAHEVIAGLSNDLHRFHRLDLLRKCSSNRINCLEHWTAIVRSNQMDGKADCRSQPTAETAGPDG